MRKIKWSFLLVSLSAFLSLGIFSLASAQTYGSNFITGGTVSCASALGVPFTCSMLVDGNTATRWASANASPSNDSFSYDLGSGVSKEPAKMRLNTYSDVNGQGFKDWTLLGSNDNFTTTSTIATGTTASVADNTWNEWTWTPSSTAYRYVRVNIDNTHSNSRPSAYEWEMMECTDCGAPAYGSSTGVTVTTGGNNGIMILGFITLAGAILWTSRN